MEEIKEISPKVNLEEQKVEEEEHQLEDDIIQPPM